MPINYKLYPSNWKSEIRPTILKRAKNCCEECGIENYAVGYRSAEGIFYTIGFINNELDQWGRDMFDGILANCEKNGRLKNPTKIVLTIAHLDHNIENNDPSNLKALCQYHHLMLDSERHRTNARKTIERKKGLQSLF